MNEDSKSLEEVSLEVDEEALEEEYHLQEIQEHLESILQPILEDFSDMAETLIKWQEALMAVEEGIVKFPTKEKYSPDSVEIKEEAVGKGFRDVENLANSMENYPETIPEQVDYSTRLRRGLEAFREEEYLLATFIFISIQDGFMSLICRAKGIKPEGEDYYTKSQKKKHLAEEFTEIAKLNSGVLKNKLDHFWTHRNAVMHGDAEAYFDENVAKVSLLFLKVTISAMFEVTEEES
jgi:hypothetical protein